MKIGFYAPLKSPHHQTPSGDRTLARLFIRLLEFCGHEVELVSELRSWDGDGARQQQIRMAAGREVERLLAAYRAAPPHLIFVYHLYHKAPDWLGIELAARLGIPYLLAEASFAPRQSGGKWNLGHEQSRRCIKAADAIICLNPRDNPGLEAVRGSGEKIINLRPFMAAERASESPPAIRAALAAANNLPADIPWIVSVGMMRAGDKLASYQALVSILSALQARHWQAVVIGDGPATAEVRDLFARFDARCHFTGALAATEVARWLSASDLMLWPAVNEAFGMSLLEAAAAGLPAVVYDYGGVATIVADGESGYVCRPGDREQFIQRATALLTDAGLRRAMGQRAQQQFARYHTLEAAAKTVHDLLTAYR